MKKWTVMFYLAGDNNLSEDMITSMRGIQKAMQAEDSDKDINLLAIYDSGYPTVPITAYHFTQANAAKSLKDCVFTRNISRFQKERENREDTARIKDFVELIATDRDFLAEDYALIMSGHSDAILGKTMFRDDNPDDKKLDLRFLANILRTSADFLTNRDKFSVVGFDSCMMGMIEVGCELFDSTELLVASQGFAPTYGWDYEEILKDFVTRKGNISPLNFAKSIAKRQIDSSSNFSIGGRSMNLSVVDVSEANNLAGTLNDLGKIFNKILTAKTDDSVPREKAEANAVVIECVKNLIHDSHYYSQTYLHEQAVDILDFVESLSANCELKRKELELMVGTIQPGSAAESFNEKLGLIQNQCSIVKTKAGQYIKANHANGADYQFSEGVSVFFPWTRLALNLVYRSYEKIAFAQRQAPAWLEFLEIFTMLTFRSNGARKFDGSLDFVKFQGEIITLNRASTAKDSEITRASTAKASTAKAEMAMFYRLFGRHRNHPIFHDFIK